MKKLILLTVVLTVTATAFAEDMVALKTDLPKPLMVGTPVPINIPKLETRIKKFPEFQVPAGTVNLAKGKKVSSSDNDPVIGTLDLITDGDKEGDEGSWVELGSKKQWVQIDLEKAANISAIVVWHFHSQERVYRDVVVQISDDPKFEKDSMAMRGTMPIVRVIRLAAKAICATCSAVGSMFTVVSAQNTTCRSVTSMYMPLTSLALGCAPMTWSAGRMVSG